MCIPAVLPCFAMDFKIYTFIISSMYTFVSDYVYEYCALLAQQIRVYYLRAYIY